MLNIIISILWILHVYIIRFHIIKSTNIYTYSKVSELYIEPDFENK